MRTPSERVAQGLPNQLPTDRKERTAVLRTRRPKKPKLPQDVKDLRQLAGTFDTEGDLVEIWERRMLNPDTKQSRPIRVNTPGMHLRWINLSTNGRYQRARYDEGWVPVEKKELVDEREIYGVSYTTEGYVCRGEKQGEMLMKIPEAVWKKIRARKYEQVRKSNDAIKANMQAAGAKHFSDKYNSNRGEEIAESLAIPQGESGAFRGNIKFGTEHVEPDPIDLEPQYETEGAQ